MPSANGKSRVFDIGKRSAAATPIFRYAMKILWGSARRAASQSSLNG